MHAGDASNPASDAAAAAASSALAATADVAKRLKKRKKDAKRPPQVTGYLITRQNRIGSSVVLLCDTEDDFLHCLA